MQVDISVRSGHGDGLISGGNMSVAGQGAVTQLGEGKTPVHQDAERTIAKGRMEKPGMCLAGKERKDGSHGAALSRIGQGNDRRSPVGRGIEIRHRSACPRVWQGENRCGSSGGGIISVQIGHRPAGTQIRQREDGGGTRCLIHDNQPEHAPVCLLSGILVLVYVLRD